MPNRHGNESSQEQRSLDQYSQFESQLASLDPEAWKRVTKLVRDWLRSRKRDPREAVPILAELERWARLHKRRPGEAKRDEDLYFPAAVSRKARALQVECDKHQEELTNMLRLLMRYPSGEPYFAYTQPLPAFDLVLNILASEARPNRRPRDRRLRSIERGILTCFDRAGLPYRASQYAADILSEIRADALGAPVPSQKGARLKALRDAVRRLETST